MCLEYIFALLQLKYSAVFVCIPAERDEKCSGKNWASQKTAAYCDPQTVRHTMGACDAGHTVCEPLVAMIDLTAT